MKEANTCTHVGHALTDVEQIKLKFVQQTRGGGKKFMTFSEESP